MSLMIIPKAALPDWIKQLTEKHRVVGPKSLEDRYFFDEIHDSTEVDLDYPTTILPPKKTLLPIEEELFQFDLTGSRLQIKPLIKHQTTVILGVHTCDLHAIRLMDQVFKKDFIDQHYLTRRENTTLISIECLKTCSDYAFCKSMGTISPPEEFDMHLTDIGDDYAIDIGSNRGEKLMPHLATLREATDQDLRQLQKVMSEKWSRFRYTLDFDVTELPALLAVSYDSALWKEIGDQCLACGTCNLVCPTCFCFNVVDDTDFSLAKGRRYRVWDSCQLDRFASVAGGHDFRSTRGARQRHRFFHKGKYQTETYGRVACVGCGRCAQSCLLHFSPVEIFNELYRRQVPFASIQQEVLV